MSVKVQDYALKSPHMYRTGVWADPITLPAGLFVKPIEYRYVPKHVLEKYENTGHDDSKCVFCYTSYGIISIPRELIREI